MLLTVGGAVTAVTQGNPAAVLADGLKPGEWLIFGCVVCWSAYTLIGRKVLRGIDALTVAAVTSMSGALMLSAVAWFAEGLPLGAVAVMDGRGWFALLWLAVGATVLAYAWYFEGVKVLGAGGASVYVTLVPIFGMLCSVWFLGEPLHISLAAGCAAAAGGMILIHLGQNAA
ncbi:Predicted permease, DMT superfamily [Neisseria cinerea]|nr:Predicted permease, DMT superfamily [Neisseria cinerea]